MGECEKSLIRKCEMCGSGYPSSIKVYKGAGVNIYSDFNNQFNVLLFVVSGKIIIDNHNSPSQSISEGEFVLMEPKGRYSTVTEDSYVVAYHFNSILSNCTRTFLNRFLSYERVIDDKFSVCSSLPIKSQIRNILLGVVSVLEETDVCPHYYDIKIEEMFICLTMYYSLDELFTIFYRLVSEDLDFRSFVYSNYEQVESVDNFAKLASMSKITFIRTFQKNFGISPSTWLRDKKCESIIKDIVLTQIPFSELSYKYSFSSPAYFTLFCKKRWGKTPNELRKEKVLNASKV